ncbi:hypothetical protein RclHR1_06110007 [Rhizophagus clarus]|uniref:Attractin/MKLN-like beta-propeller domain-containing protein n=1 Tax=Rhizophagus clarus TaxID=94130 RepID=A0A2Z6RWG9_9GLOM|nr:hypothetical protein RclHR1_06110007 [Rhizophagus clarus]GES90122.1 hypothetical protein GLOIN_2v1476032 [Rhizophagus clarus]
MPGRKMNFINYLYIKKTLHIFLFLVLGIFVIKIDSFTGERAGHSSVLIGSKLYFFGGFKINTFLSDEVFYLDVSKPFNIESPPWVDLTIHSKMPFGSAMTTMSLVYINNEPIACLFGGLMDDSYTDINMYYKNVHTFNPRTLEWNVPSIKGKEPLKRRNIRGASDDTGKIYIFSGFRNSDFYFYDEMVILDTVNSMWSYGSTLNMPIRRAGYSATMLKNGVIVYIGGSMDQQQITVDINHIELYDTKRDTWSSMIATNTSFMESRFFHSAVLDPDENIIVYGGRKSKVGFGKVEPAVIVLNTRKTPFEWTAPIISTNVGHVQATSGHTANLVGNYMVVAFGNITELLSRSRMYSSRMYMMDIRNYTWVENFEAIEDTKNKTEETPIPTSVNLPGNIQKIKIVIGVISGVIVLVILSIFGFLGYKKRENEESIRVKNLSHVSNEGVI